MISREKWKGIISDKKDTLHKFYKGGEVINNNVKKKKNKN